MVNLEARFVQLTSHEQSEAALARVRTFLDVTVRSWLSNEHRACDDSCGYRAIEQERFDQLQAALEMCDV